MNKSIVWKMKPIPAVPVALYKSHYKTWKVASKVTVATIGLTSKLFFKCFHETNVYPSQYHLDDLVRKNCGRPIITVSNHMRYTVGRSVFLIWIRTCFFTRYKFSLRNSIFASKMGKARSKVVNISENHTLLIWNLI